MQTKTIILLLLYIIPFTVNWYWVHLLYFNEKGDYYNKNLNPGIPDFLGVILPAWNLFMMCFVIIDWEDWKASKYRNESSPFLTMFFGSKPNKK